MNIYQKFFKYYIFFVFIVIVLLIGNFYLFHFNLLNNFLNEYSNKQKSQIDFIIKKEKQHLKEIAYDWAKWNDSYNFVKTKNKKFIFSNFGGGNTLLNLGIQGMVFLDDNCNLIYGRYLENNKEKIIKKLPPFDYDKNGFHIFLLNNKIYLVYVTDVTTTKMDKKYGKLVVYKILNNKLFEQSGLKLIKFIHNKKYKSYYKIKGDKLILYYPLKNITLVFEKDIKSKLLFFEKYNLIILVYDIFILILLFLLGVYFIRKLTKDIDFIFETLTVGVKKTEYIKKLINYNYYLSEFEKLAQVFQIIYEKLFNYEKIYNILEEVPFAVMIYKDNILYANKFVFKWLNTTQDEIKKLNPLDFLDEPLKEKVLEVNKKRENGENIILKYKTFINYRDKEIYVFIVSFPVIYNNIKANMVFIIDLTKEYEIEELLKKILDNSPFVIFEIKNCKNKIVNISKNIEKYIGVKTNEINDDWWGKHLHPKDKEKFLKDQILLKEKGKVEHIYRLRKKDNSYIWVWEHVFYQKQRCENVFGFWINYTKEEILKRLNITLGNINKFLISVKSEKEIIEYVCEELIKSEVFKFAWIGKIKENMVIPVRHFGEGKEYLDDLIIKINNGVLSKGPTGQALDNNNIIGINPNTFTNEKIIPWRENQLKNGFYSSIAIKLIDDLTINLYSEYTDFYTKEVIDLILSIRSSVIMAFEKNNYIKTLKHLTFFDDITGLGNLNKFKKDLNEYNKRFILCLINIKDFTSINANFGFEYGNLVLKKVGEKLKKHIKKDDEIYRIYNDRFLLFLKTDKWNLEVIKSVTDRIHHVFSNEGISIDDNRIYLEMNGSIISSQDIEKEKVFEGLIYAYVFAKNSVNKFVIYEPWMHKEVKERIYLKELLFKAIREKLFEVYFQPIVDINTYKVVQFEALLRLKDKDRFINMEKFINIANELQLVPEITKIVVEKVIEYIKIFKNVKENIGISINISKFDMNKNFLEFFKKSILNNKLEFKHFSMEITERESVEDTELTKNFVKELKEVGVKLEIDDFGIAYSNFKETVDIDFDILKIDKSFVDKIFKERIQIAVRSIIFLAKSFNAKTIAEGVETKEQLEKLKELGVDYIQGYYFAKPMPFSEAIEYLKTNA
ncbi:conserved hypothetical protein [Lebetimonas natsushimae]|uniref:EAL domain-containing protein n=1 Tax=Lebetimonas natsushimae TaxID=1936991 RepID=A0A292YER0_9BACT|nr:EAL domain-containing protein [Lebetimonas natsushimae]GAX87739.1 conserved hypothetical protein [Lebetimonas natsushimae]